MKLFLKETDFLIIAYSCVLEFIEMNKDRRSNLYVAHSTNFKGSFLGGILKLLFVSTFTK